MYYINKHDNANCITTHLDPFEDLMILWESFKSLDYINEVLQLHHGINNTRRRKKLAEQIKIHTSHGLELTKQAIETSNDTSFILLYYACLNLSKTVILFKGNEAQLARNRWHGASYKDSMILKKNPLNEFIEVKKRGTIALLYNTLTNKSINQDHKVYLKDIYPFIDDISAEYSRLFNKECQTVATSINIISSNDNEHYLRIEDINRSENLISSRKIGAIKRMRIKKIHNQEYYVSPSQFLPFNDAKVELLKHIDRTIISDIDWSGDLYTSIPISAKSIVYPQEILITLAFFYLSNVSRYNPEHLNKLKDSKVWVLMFALKKQGFFKFLKTMYSHIMKESFCITQN